MKIPRLATLGSICGFSAIFALTASTVHASLIAYDGYDGSTISNGGTGWTGDWNSGQNAGDNLTYGGLTTTGVGAIIAGYWNGASTRSFPAQTSGTMWFSWIQNSGGTDTGNPNQIRIMSGGSRAFTIGQHFDGNTFKIYDGNFNTGANTARPITGTHLVVVSVDLATSLVNLYIDPTGIGAAAPTSAVTATWDGPGSIASINGLQSVGGGNSFAWDEVRVGTSWADVTPGTGDTAPEPIPDAPSNLVAAVNSFSDINLSWTDNSTNEFNFILERSPDGVNGWAPIATLDANVTAYQDVGLSATTTYYYRLKATNATGDSAYAAVSSATTPAAPTGTTLDTIYLPFADDDGTDASLITPVTGVSSITGTGLVTTAAALAYPGVPSTGNGLTTNSGRVFINLNTSLSGFAPYLSGGQIGGSGTGVLYVSWMARGINGQEANTIDFRTGSTGANEETVSVGTTFGNDFVRLMTANAMNSGWTSYTTTTHVPSAGTDFYVLKFTFGAGATSTVELYINQTSQGTPDASSTCFARFNTIGFTKFGSAAAPALDEFRIGTTWNAVTGTVANPIGAYFGTFGLPTDGTGNGAYTADPDGDGMNNLMEYAFKGNPTVADTSILPSVGTQNISGSDYLTITFERLTSATSGVTYTPESSGDLTGAWNGTPVQVGSAVNNGNGTETVVYRDSTALGAGVKRFMRVRVSAP